jgi:hypothetical protein
MNPFMVESGYRRATVFAALAAAVLTALVLASGAGAAPPVHDSFTFHDQFVDTDTCSFPVAGDTVFTNDITEWLDYQGVTQTLHLNQSTVGTFTAKGTTLRLNIRETIIVEFVDGAAVTAKHVGLLNSIVGPGGPVFLRTGQALFEVVGGFDGPLIARHGLRDVFDPVEFCAAFG